MSASHCSNCGAEVIPGYYPKFCRQCGENLTPDEDHQTFPSDEDDIGREYSLYNFQELEELIDEAVPEDHQTLTPPQLKNHIVQTIWKRVMGIDPQPYDRSLVCEEREQAMLKYIEDDKPPSLLLPSPRSQAGQSVKYRVRQYHLVWVNGLINRTHFELTAEECGHLRTLVAEFYYHLEPCTCDEVDLIPSESNPQYMRKR